MVVSVAAVSVVAGTMAASSARAQPAPVTPVTQTQCVDVTSGPGIARLCVTATRSEQGYVSGTAELRTKSTVLATVRLRQTHDGETYEPLPVLNFLEVLAIAALQAPQLNTVEVCATGGVGIDSKDYGEVCVTLPPAS